MTILDDLEGLATGQTTPSQIASDWMSMPSVKLALAALIFGGGVVIILTHRHRHDISRAFAAAQRSVPLAAFMV